MSAQTEEIKLTVVVVVVEVVVVKGEYRVNVGKCFQFSLSQ